MFGPTRPVAIRPASATRCSAARPIVRGLIGECSWGWRWQSATRISLGSLWKKGPIRYCDQAMVSSLSPAAAERAKDCNASTSGSGSSPGRLGVRRTFRDPDRSPIAVGVPGHPRLPGPRQRACEGCMLGPFSDFGIGDAALLPAYWSSERARPAIGELSGHTQVQATAQHANLVPDSVKSAPTRTKGIIDGNLVGAADGNVAAQDNEAPLGNLRRSVHEVGGDSGNSISRAAAGIDESREICSAILKSQATSSVEGAESSCPCAATDRILDKRNNSFP